MRLILEKALTSKKARTKKQLANLALQANNEMLDWGGELD